MATLGIGSTLSYSSTFGGSYTPIANCRSIDVPSLEFKMVDTTNLDTTGKSMTGIAAPLGAPGKCTAEAIWSHSSSSALLAQEGIDQFWRLTVSGTSTADFYFPGFVSSIKRSVKGHDELVMLTVEVQQTGAMTEITS